MTEHGFALFDTDIGRCGIAWGARGIIGVQLPEAGATLSYGEIAARLGERGLARDVGQALGRNPLPLIVPCHRVLAAGGKAGGFSANGGVTTKLRLLTIERARTSDAPTLFDGDRAFGFALKPKAQRRR